jgi:hypothetical protein
VIAWLAEWWPWLAGFYVSSPWLLLVLYRYGIKHERGGWWRAFWPLAFAAQCLSVFCNWLVFPWAFGFPMRGEWTFSKALSRLRYESPLCKAIAQQLDAWAPSGRHVR